MTGFTFVFMTYNSNDYYKVKVKNCSVKVLVYPVKQNVNLILSLLVSLNETGDSDSERANVPFILMVNK